MDKHRIVLSAAGWRTRKGPGSAFVFLRSIVTFVAICEPPAIPAQANGMATDTQVSLLTTRVV